jgi:spermidine/putrescine transport system permease protein
MGPWNGFTLKWYGMLLEDRYILESLYYTITIAVVATTVSTIVGTISAIGIYRMRTKLKQAYLFLNNIPVLVPDIVMGITLMSLFIFMGVKMGLATVIIAHITFCIPFVILSVLPRFNRLPENLFEAALDLGATPKQAFWKVLFPEILPGVTSGALIAFTLSIDDFVISFFTTGNGVSNLSITIYSMAKAGINPKINALSTIMFGCIMLLLMIINIRSEKELNQI